MTDLIGDIHGHADELQALLSKMGYQKKGGSYFHPERKVLFVGDYIDRGPKIRETLHLVRNMVEAGNAIALIGNHEYNALCFHYLKKEGGHLRTHNIKNIVQHYQTLAQFQNLQQEYDSFIHWFKTLPLYHETPEFRAVHACWDQANIHFLSEALDHACLTDELIYQSADKGSLLNLAVEETLKGKEMQLPDGCFFSDKDGTSRTEIRIKWWGENPTQMSYRDLAIEFIEDLPDQKPAEISSIQFYTLNEIPVFCGHY